MNTTEVPPAHPSEAMRWVSVPSPVLGSTSSDGAGQPSTWRHRSTIAGPNTTVLPPPRPDIGPPVNGTTGSAAPVGRENRNRPRRIAAHIRPQGPGAKRFLLLCLQMEDSRNSSSSLERERMLNLIFQRSSIQIANVFILIFLM